ncbi:hypothetical protein [Methanobrevibacter sp.]|uniref:hypothetical protein n=1 Tax=Methanobrevibacter sp. TaxID=66852 RepID=UPI00388EF017
MNIKKIFFALVVTALLIGSACAANMNDFKVDGFNSSYINDNNSAYISSNGDSGVSIYKNTNAVYHDDDGYYDDDGDYDYDDDGYYDYDDAYDHDYDDHYYAQNTGKVVNGIQDDMQLTKNADNTATFTDYDDAQHGIIEVVEFGGQQYTVVFWAHGPTSTNNTDLMAKLTKFNSDNGVAPIAF